MEITKNNLLAAVLIVVTVFQLPASATNTRQQPQQDPWTGPARKNNSNKNKDPWLWSQNKPTDGRSGLGGSTADCQEAINKCSMFNVDPASLNNVYQQAFAAALKKQRLTYQHNLKKARDFFINMFNRLILSPDATINSVTCAGADVPVQILNDPTDVILGPDSVRDVVVPPLSQCVVSEWSDWSLPLSFGVVERRRSIKKQGQCCPGEKFLVERINITTYLDKDTSAFENPNNVGENFNNDFLSNDPRDILLIIDTSSSIFRADFEVMKEGIKTMIDLFCGGFGDSDKNNRLAIMQYSNNPVIVHYFSDPQTPQALKITVDNMTDFGGWTCTGDALKEAHDAIFTTSKGARPHMPNDTLVVTDGHANCGANLLEAAHYLQKRSESIYALGIGISSDSQARAQVTSIVTNENPHHIFSLARYPDFKLMIDYIKQRQRGKTCTPIIPKNKK